MKRNADRFDFPFLCRGPNIKDLWVCLKYYFSLEKQFRLKTSEDFNLNCFLKKSFAWSVEKMKCYESVLSKLQVYFLLRWRISCLAWTECCAICLMQLIMWSNVALGDIASVNHQSNCIVSIMQILQLFRQRLIADNSLQLFMHRTTGSKQCNLLGIEEGYKLYSILGIEPVKSKQFTLF